MRPRRCYTFLVLLFTLVNAVYYTQSRIDSLEKIISAAKPKDKIRHIFKITKICRDAGLLKKGLAYDQLALSIASDLKNNAVKADAYNEIGIYYETRSQLDSALEMYLRSFTVHELNKSKGGIALLTGNIGNIYRLMRNYNKARGFLRNSLKLQQELKSPSQIAAAEMSLGSYYYDVSQLDSSIVFFQSALTFYKTAGEKMQIADIVNNMGSLYNELNKYDDAIKNYTYALQLYTELGNTGCEAMALANLGNVYNESGKPHDGIAYSLKALKMAKDINAKNLIVPIYIFLIEGSQKLGDDKKVMEYQAALINYKDTIYDLQSNQNIAEMQTRFDTERKDTENKLLKQQNDLQSLSIKQQKIISYSVVGGLLLVLALAFYIFKGYKEKQKVNLQLEEKNGLIEEKNKIVEEKQKEMIDSINYAKRIQYSLLAPDDFLTANLSPAGGDGNEGYFVYFNPKDIVSGDFYWATKKENKFYLAICDSTGHGVPGAFMSLLNIGYLSEAINEKGIEKPNEVFNYVRRRLVDTISKEGQKDGFDGVLICMEKIVSEQRIEESRIKITYAAANNKPLLISNQICKELGGDRMPVGMGDKQQDFELYTVDAKPGDNLYLYTDGYADQFGGTKGKKYKYKSLNEFILTNHQKPLAEQQQLLKTNFNNWRGNLEQVDDVCVIGIKL